jgi:hypothetical protein
MSSRESWVTVLQKAIAQGIVRRTSGRIRALSVEVGDDAVVIRGCVDCFHLKQLALQGARDVLGAESSARIELDIQVEIAPPPFFVDPRPSSVA